MFIASEEQEMTPGRHGLVPLNLERTWAAGNSMGGSILIILNLYRKYSHSFFNEDGYDLKTGDIPV